MPHGFAQSDSPVLGRRTIEEPGGTPAPLRSFAVAGALCAVLTAVMVWGLTGTLWSLPLAAGLGLYGAAFAWAAHGIHSSYPHNMLGSWNLVTLIRLALVASLFSVIIAGTSSASLLLATVLVAFLLDGVDGWLARRAEKTSVFGARFDVEVDSVFALLLAGLAVQSGLHPAVILLGLPRYAFGLAQILYPRLASAPLPVRFSRKLVCVLQIAALIIMGMAWIDPGLRHGIAIACAAILTWSFAVDIRALLRTSN